MLPTTIWLSCNLAPPPKFLLAGSLFLPLNGPPQFRPKCRPGQPRFIPPNNADLAPIVISSSSLPNPIPPNDDVDPVTVDDSPQDTPPPHCDANTGPIPSDEDNVDMADSSSEPLQGDHNGNPIDSSFQPFVASSLPNLEPPGDHVGPDSSSRPLQNDAGLGQANLPDAKSSVAPKPASLLKAPGNENVGPTTINGTPSHLPNGRPVIIHPTILRPAKDVVKCPVITSLPQPSSSTAVAAGVDPSGIHGSFRSLSANNAGMVPVLTHPSSCNLPTGVVGPVVIRGPTPTTRARPKLPKKSPIIIPSLIPNANNIGPIFIPTRRHSTNQPFLPSPNGGFVPDFTWLPPVASPRDDPLTAPLLSRLLYPQYHANVQGMPGSSEEGPNQSNK